jgi:hypothetical protein
MADLVCVVCELVAYVVRACGASHGVHSVLSSRMEWAACTKSHGLHVRHSTARCNTVQICLSAYVRFRNRSEPHSNMTLQKCWFRQPLCQDISLDVVISAVIKHHLTPRHSLTICIMVHMNMLSACMKPSILHSRQHSQVVPMDQRGLISLQPKFPAEFAQPQCLFESSCSSLIFVLPSKMRPRMLKSAPTVHWSSNHEVHIPSCWPPRVLVSGVVCVYRAYFPLLIGLPFCITCIRATIAHRTNDRSPQIPQQPRSCIPMALSKSRYVTYKYSRRLNDVRHHAPSKEQGAPSCPLAQQRHVGPMHSQLLYFGIHGVSSTDHMLIMPTPEHNIVWLSQCSPKTLQLLLDFSDITASSCTSCTC